MKKIFILSLGVIFVASMFVTALPAEAQANPALYCPFTAGPNETLVMVNQQGDDKLFSNRGEDGAIWNFSTSIPKGTYDITLVGHDSYEGRQNVTQSREQYHLILKNGSQTLATTNSLKDLQDRTFSATEVTKVNTGLVVSDTITTITVRHSAYPDTATSHSIVPVCVLFEKIDTEENLIGSCSITPTNTETGKAVVWTASASGGTGNISYSWSGTEGLSGSGTSVSKTYTTEGVKTGSVTITSGTQSITRNCTTVIENEAEENLNVSCIPNGDEYEIDERVTWQAIVSGGNGSYTYDWSGTDGLSGTSRTVSQRYDDEGTKRADVTVRSGDGQTKTANCRITIEEEEDDDDFEVTCEVSETRIEAGDRVTFDVDIEGGDSPFDVRWSGDYRDIDDFDRDRQRQTVRIDEEGRYELEVEVTDDEGRRASDECRVVIVDDEDEPTVTVTTNTPTGQVAGVALSQVPYTGLTDNPVLNAILYSFAGLTLLVIGMVSLFILRKRDIVPVFAGKVMTQGQVADYSEDEIVSALEDVAHKNRVIVSAEAMDTLMLRSKNNKVKAMMLLNTAIKEAKKDISTDAWLVLSKQKMANVL